MKTPSILLLAGALVLAGGAALLARVLLAPPPPPPVVKAQEPVVVPPSKPAVLVVTRELQPGQFINAGALAWVETDADLPAMQYYVRDKDEMSLVFGATVRKPLRAGEPLSASSVVHVGEPGFLAAVLKPGMRAIALPTNAVASSTGLIAAGDRVDVILSLDKEALQASDATFPPPLAAQTLLRDVRVLALDRHTRSDLVLREQKKDPKTANNRARELSYALETVTLEVTPGQAERLALTKEIGVLQLTLRSSREPSSGVPQSGTRDVTRVPQATDVYPGSASSPVMLYRGASVEAQASGR